MLGWFRRKAKPLPRFSCAVVTVDGEEHLLLSTSSALTPRMFETVRQAWEANIGELAAIVTEPATLAAANRKLGFLG